MTQPVPNISAPLVEVKDNNGKIIGKGFLLAPWNMFLQQFTQKPEGILAIGGTSPYVYEAKAHGTIIITGGTISALRLRRGNVTTTITGAMIIPVRIGDEITVVYSVQPLIQFLPD